MKATKEQVERANDMREEIKGMLARAEPGIPITLSFAVWHVQQVEALEAQLDNLRREHALALKEL